MTLECMSALPDRLGMHVCRCQTVHFLGHCPTYCYFRDHACVGGPFVVDIVTSGVIDLHFGCPWNALSSMDLVSLEMCFIKIDDNEMELSLRSEMKKKEKAVGLPLRP